MRKFNYFVYDKTSKGTSQFLILASNVIKCMVLTNMMTQVYLIL